MTRRTTIASKNSSQGLSQQLSNLQVRCGIKEIKLNSTQKIVVNCFSNCLQSVLTGAGYTALYPCFNNWLQSVPTGYTALYSCFNNCLQSVQTRYRLHNLGTAYPTPTGYRVIRPSPLNSVLILGQVDSKYLQIWLQLTGYRVCKSQTSLPSIQPYFHQNRLQSDHLNHWLQSLPTRYRLYNLASPKPVTESTQLANYRPVAV